tara:strand:- start:232 stop:567 length:336 start_codon:yes stop_codon:yes gene_type:complete
MIKFIFFFSLFIFTSCTWNEIIPVSDSGNCNPDEQVFLDLIQPIIENNCIACHNDNSGSPAILSSFNGVIDALELDYSLKDRVVDQQMPPYGLSPLSDSEINIIQKWADCE